MLKNLKCRDKNIEQLQNKQRERMSKKNVG